MLKARIVTGVTFTAILISVLFLLPAWVHFILLMGVFALCESEFYSMVKRAGHQFLVVETSVCGIFLIIVSAIESPVVMNRFNLVNSPGIMDLSGLVLCLTPAVLLSCAVFRRKTEHAMETFALSYAGFWYVAVLLCFVMRIAFEWNVNATGNTNYTGRLMFLLFVCIVKFGDIGAYTVGCLLGKHKLIPEISPKKTVEGLFGGYIFSILTSLVFWGAAQYWGNGHLGEERFTILQALFLPLMLTTAGMLGDLSESLIKRSVSIKDSGTGFPGMGGILDILDSLLFAAPFMYVYIILFKH